MALTFAQSHALLNSPLAPSLNITYLSPVILDLNGDGIQTLGLSSGVAFDLSATGQKANVGWVSPGDGLLVLDRNHNGVIDDGSELFGTSTLLPDGTRAANGYAALKAMDSNGDGVISNKDAGWADLKIWRDTNSDGVSQQGELVSLDSLGITKLNLAASPTSVMDNGNWIGMVSSFETADGKTHDMADVWFQTNQPAPAPAPADLRTSVTGLVQAMSSFAELQSATGQSAAQGAAASPLDAKPGSAAASLAVSTNVGGMADLLRQFDAYGNLLSPSTETVPGISTGSSTSLTGLLDPAKTNFLANSGK
jgi:hypothetical protein